MKYFTYSEFDQKGLEGSGEEFMDADFLANLDILRGKCGFPFYINSGYRSPEYNNKVSSTGFTGPHTTGKAADVVISREKVHTILEFALPMRCFHGIGVQQKGNNRFIHLDSVEGKKRFWSY